MTSAFNFVKEPTNEVDNNVLAMVLPKSNEVIGPVHQNTSMIVSMFLSLPHCALDIFATEKNASMMDEVNTDRKSLQIFIFMDLKRQLNWLKNNKGRRKLK